MLIFFCFVWLYFRKPLTMLALIYHFLPIFCALQLHQFSFQNCCRAIQICVLYAPPSCQSQTGKWSTPQFSFQRLWCTVQGPFTHALLGGEIMNSYTALWDHFFSVYDFLNTFQSQGNMPQHSLLHSLGFFELLESVELQFSSNLEGFQPYFFKIFCFPTTRTPTLCCKFYYCLYVMHDWSSYGWGNKDTS